MSLEFWDILSKIAKEKTPLPGPHSTMTLSLVKSILPDIFLTAKDEDGVTEAIFLSFLYVLMY